MRSILNLFANSLLLLGCWQTALASVLPEFEPQTLRPGELYEQAIDWHLEEGLRVEISLVSAPDNAHLRVSDDGLLVLEWQTGPDLADETLLFIQVRDVDAEYIIETREFVVRNVLSMPLVHLSKPAPAKPIQAVEVSLEPLVSQIVSTGQSVSVYVNSSTSDGEDALVSIDRLPANAIFDKTKKGIHTFFWQTDDRDQGEHRFRVSAQHPADSSAYASRDVVIVVGDPSRNKTFPEVAQTSEN